MIYYLDTSALVKAYVDVRALLREAADEESSTQRIYAGAAHETGQIGR